MKETFIKAISTVAKISNAESTTINIAGG